MEIFRKSGNVVAEPYLTADEALRHRDLVANDEIVEVLDPERGRVRTIGPIARLAETAALPGERVPEIGEHTRAVRAESNPPRVLSRTDGAIREPGHPLAGIRIVDFSTIIAGPLATSMLADLGARVIKVEGVEGDPYRHLLPHGLLAVKTNAGKESIALDAKSEAGREIVRELIATADVVVHNFRAGVDERLGIDEPTCRALAPNCIWVATRGYGLNGPDALRPATHPVIGAAMSGAGYQAGVALDRPCGTLEEIRESARQLMRANEANPDPNTSGVVAAAILLALFARERTGRGQRIDVSMMVANAWANADAFVDYAGKPPRPRLDSELMGLAPGYRMYPTSDGWISLAVTSEAEWRRLAEATGRSELANPSSRSADDLAALFREGTSESWEARLWPARVGCMRADGPGPGSVWLEDPQVRANHLAVGVEHARFGETLRWGPLVTVNGQADRYGPGALSGDHTDTILRDLGRNDEQIRALREAGVVGSEPV
jgi:crotonobetainyl-CoA:carnitine CoA-transferase CaiB-like acyl-CoA transferase